MQFTTIFSTTLLLLATTSVANPTPVRPAAVEAAHIPSTAEIEAREPARVGGLLSGLGRLGSRLGSKGKPSGGKPSAKPSPSSSRPNAPKPKPKSNSTTGGLLGDLIPRDEEETTQQQPREVHHSVKLWEA
jgi:hypothetical protein